MAALPWILSGERSVGRGHATLTDVDNRPLRTMLTTLGLDPDASFIESSLSILKVLVTGSTIARSLADRFGKVRDVQDYGTASDNWGVRVQAAIDALPATGGVRVLDATGLTGAQVLTADLTFNKKYMTLLISKDIALSMAAYRFVVTAGTHGVRIRMVDSVLGGFQALNGAYPEPALDYTGTGSAILVGDGTTVTYGFYTDDLGLKINGGGAPGCTAVGMELKTQLYGKHKNLTILGTLDAGTTQIGVKLDGTHASLFTGWITFDQPIFNRIYRGFHGTGSGVNAANAITINGGSLQGANNYATATAGKGIYLEVGKGWFVQGLDIDNFERGVDCDGSNCHMVIRSENNDQGVYLSSNASANHIWSVRDDGTTPSDAGTLNQVWQAGVMYGNFQATGITHTFGAAGGASLTFVMKAATATTRWMTWATGSNLRWGHGTDNTAESGTNAGSNWFQKAYDDAGTLIDTVCSIVRAAGGAITFGRPLTLLNGPKILTGAGTPEAAVAAPVGSVFFRTDGGASTSMYVKESGTGNTGWVGK